MDCSDGGWGFVRKMGPAEVLSGIMLLDSPKDQARTSYCYILQTSTTGLLQQLMYELVMVHVNPKFPQFVLRA